MFCHADDNTTSSSVHRIIKKGITENPRDFSQTNDSEALVVTSGIGNQISVHFRYLSPDTAAEILAFVFAAKNHTDQAEYYKRYLFCQSIGQKLLYPKHYFW